MTTVGSLCTGYGGLELATRHLWSDVETVFVADPDPHVTRWLDQRMPDVPNLGDITALDSLPDCDVVTAGFPCQPASTAGQRRGVDDDRWLWPHIERVLGGMGRPPSVVLLENVPGLLSVNGGDAMADVVGGLRSLGFVGRWGRLAASAIGACHRRDRLWIAATHPDSVRRREITRSSHGDKTADGRRGTQHHHVTGGAGPQRLLPTPRTSDTNGPGTHGDGGLDLRTAATLLPTPTARDWKDGVPQPNVPVNSLLGRTVWNMDGYGPYTPAVARWADIIGRPPPPATELSPDGKSRLNPVFVEWMMGLPEGWVTDVGLSRTTQLHMLGNGVVPQQAVAAYSMLLERMAVAALDQEQP